MDDEFDDHRVYTTFEVAQLFQVTIPTVVIWTKNGGLSHYRTPGGHRRIPHASVVAYARDKGLPLPDGFTAPEGPVSILLVDTSVDFLETWRDFFPVDKVSISVVHDAMSAGIAIVQNHQCVVVVNIDVPGIAADTVVDRVWSASGTRRPSVVALTDYVSPVFEDKLRKSGFVEVIQKPISLAQATAMVMRFVP